MGVHQYQATFSVYPFGVGGEGNTTITQDASSGNRRYAIHSQFFLVLDQVALYHALNCAVAQFSPGSPGDPKRANGQGPNESAARVRLSVFHQPAHSPQATP